MRHAANAAASHSEPDFQQAAQWWQEMPHKWAPLGWKDHLFRFNVLWNGAVYADPALNRRTEAWNGAGINITIVPYDHVINPPRCRKWPAYVAQDDGMVRQGWLPGAAPHLWSEWAAEGLVMRAAAFGHLAGGRAVVSGVEPLFLWLRLSLHDTTPGLPLEDEFSFVLRLNAPGLHYTMSMRGHQIDFPAYPRQLRPDRKNYSPRDGLRLIEPDGRVRLAIAPGQTCRTVFVPRDAEFHDDLLHIIMPTRKGVHADLLIPMLPAENRLMRQQLQLGRAAALREANRFWRMPATVTKFAVPEQDVAAAVVHSLKMAELIAERNPASGACSTLTGSLWYANLWATPSAMVCSMALDAFGHHHAAEKYLAVFRDTQGSINPPGDHFTSRSGYLATPRELESINWLSDHGALLFAIAHHLLLSGNRQWRREWLPAIIAACDFTLKSLAIKGHGGVEGILPPAVATDAGTKIQAVWNDGWHYKGLTTAVRLLQQLDHPRAAEYAAAAAAYRRDFQRAFRAKARRMPTWRDARGRVCHLMPTSLHGEGRSDNRNAFYLDTGPLFLVFAGLLEATDPLMRATLKWFREGPQTAHYRHDGNCWQTACLDHEMSSCEPCYSWNIFHAHATADRQAFLTGMYSLFAGAVSRQTFVMSETRGGVSGMAPIAIHLWLARLALVDDQIQPGDLHLLRLMPLTWCRPDAPAELRNLPTEFGAIDLAVKLSADSTHLQITCKLRARQTPRRVILHAPPIAALKKITFNKTALKPLPQQAVTI